MRSRLTHAVVVLAVAAAGLVGVAVASAPAQALPAYTCGTQTGGSTTVHSHVTDVRMAQHSAFDRFVVVFSTARLPHYQITPKSSARFTFDASGEPIQLLGNAGLKLVLNSATGVGTYHGARDFRVRFPQLREARLLGDFEGYVTWGLGLAHESCKRVFRLSDPTRLVIDVPH